MAGLRRLAMVFIGLATQPVSFAHADPIVPPLAGEVALCTKQVGIEPQLPAGAPTPDGLMPSVAALTPATAPGALTVSPKVAACLIDRLGEELVVMAPMSDPVGIEDAFAWSGMGVGRALTDAERQGMVAVMNLSADGDLDRPVLLYCHSVRCGLSYNTIHHLKSLGYSNLLWMRAGIDGWREAGLPTGMVRKRTMRQYPPVVPAVVTWDRMGDTDYPVPPVPRKLRRQTDDAFRIQLWALCNATATGTMKGAASDDPRLSITLMKKMAGVTPADAVPAVRRKMQAFFAANREDLDCSFLAHGTTTMMKLAAREDPYLFDYITDEWSVRGAAYNAVDPEDGRTLLDWIQGAYNDPAASEDVKAKRLVLFRRLHRAGARTLDELVAANEVRSPEALQVRYIAEYKARAAAGDLRAMFHLSNVYLGGEHVPVDRAEGTRWWDKGLERTIATRDQSGMLQIGMIYAHATPSIRRDIPLDRDKAFEWIERAATLGDTADTLRAQGSFRLFGIGTARDTAAALLYLTKSFALDNWDYRTNEYLATAYYRQRDVKNLALFLRILSGVAQIDGRSVPDIAKEFGITPCGPTAKGDVRKNNWELIACDASGN